MNLRLALLAAALVLPACGQTSRTRPQQQSFDRNRLTREELATRRTENMYTVVNSLRANWIVTPLGASGVGSTAATAPTTVYLDGRELGGVDFLRSVPAESIELARFFSMTQAQAKFGMRSASPVIELISRGRTP